MWPRVCVRGQCWVFYSFYYKLTTSQRLSTVLGHLSDYLQMMLFSKSLSLVNLTVKVFRPSYAKWLIGLKLGNPGSMLVHAHQLPCSLLNCKTSTGLNPHLLKTLTPLLFIWVCMYVIHCFLRTMSLRLLEKHMSLYICLCKPSKAHLLWLPVMEYSSEIQLSYEIQGGEPQDLQLGL